MSALLSLLGKDLREHGVTALVLAFATAGVVLVTLGQNASAAFSMSPFDVVRFALLTYIPMIALVVGNRLVVREYLSRTRLFVEALPVGQLGPLLLKFVLGLVYLALLVTGLTLLAANAAGLADDVTVDYVLLLLGKSLAIVALYWSVVFCFSLCGHLRLLLYAGLAGVLAFIAWWPGIDQSRFAPFELLDEQLFVYERDVVPWQALLGTLALAAAFVVVGVLLSRLGDGSVAGRLARPMTRRDIVAFGVLLSGGLGVAGTLSEGDVSSGGAFTSEFTLRANEPPIAVLYLEPGFRSGAVKRRDRLQRSLAELQSTLGVASLPVTRLALATQLDPEELIYSTADGVRVHANWLGHDDYDDAVLDAVILHGVLGVLSGERASFEPYHWLHDGFSRWWAERAWPARREAHEAELIARAWHAVERASEPQDLVDDWQLIADQHAYPSAEALAWSALRYLEETAGEAAVLALARDRFSAPLAHSVSAMIDDRRRAPAVRFREATGLSWARFDADWRAWLERRATAPAVQRYRQAIPPLAGVVTAGYDDDGVYRLTGRYVKWPEMARSSASNDAGTAPGASSDSPVCVMKHDVLGPFDNEFDVDMQRDDSRRDVARCDETGFVHDTGGRYAPGQRLYVGFDVEASIFHQPLRLSGHRVVLRDEALPDAALAGAADR